ncbi:serine carboxypeptidase [Thelephora terrestris]|uniref:Carboxypeptidase n=1 Tax=Thelephora terrestris TaxID=56493 RepID=A0A9P6HLA9_9AGAM|nr:serine carboxypeptidase [Thelephora terrestris]
MWLDELVTHPAFSEYRLRVAEPKLCDTGVKQYSGYLDITSGKHLFFWFFESRKHPTSADFIYWTNGGPGCSSTTGLLFELGPCQIANETSVKYNKHSWNSHSNILFLDQPVNVGYSYSDDGSAVDRSAVAGEDVYAFFQLFFARFPQYSKAPFHMAAESYGGTYAPNAASIFHRKNKELALAPVPGMIKINLASVILANGLTDPYEQMASIPDWACEGPYAVYDDPQGPQCLSLRSKVPTCQRLIQSCYKFDSRWACIPAQLYCWSQLLGPLQQLGLNVYDVRRTCDRREDGPLCYKALQWVESWMNDPAVKQELGVHPSLTFESCSTGVNQAFAAQADGMRNSALLLTGLVNEGVRLLVYAGTADAMCNFMGNERWVSKFENIFHEEFLYAEPTPWIIKHSGRVAGTVRTVGGGGHTAGNVTFLAVDEAGHMVPYDQPEAALDMITRWVKNVPLTD